MNQYISEKLRVLSAIAILMVLWIHTYYTEGADFGALKVIEDFIGGSLCLVAVPLFYAISGFLFFKGADAVASLMPKMKKRVKTLLVPYLIANVLTFIFYVALNLVADRVPTIGNVLNFRVMDTVNQGLWPTLRLVFIEPPIAFQLWFLRDLMIIVVFSPIIYLVLKALAKMQGGAWLAAALGVVLVCTLHIHGMLSTLFWFSLGGWVMMNNARLDCPSSTVTIALIACWPALCVGKVILAENMPIYNSITNLLGVFAVWYGYDLLTGRKEILKSGFSKDLVGFTFFIYLVHEPLLNIFKKVPLLVNRSEAMLILCYLLVPPVAYICFMYLGKFLKRLIPGVYSIYTGNR